MSQIFRLTCIHKKIYLYDTQVEYKCTQMFYSSLNNTDLIIKLIYLKLFLQGQVDPTEACEESIVFLPSQQAETEQSSHVLVSCNHR